LLLRIGYHFEQDQLYDVIMEQRLIFTLRRDLYDSCRLRCAVNVNVRQLFPAERTTRTCRTWGMEWERENGRIHKRMKFPFQNYQTTFVHTGS